MRNRLLLRRAFGLLTFGLMAAGLSACGSPSPLPVALPNGQITSAAGAYSAAGYSALTGTWKATTPTQAGGTSYRSLQFMGSQVAVTEYCSASLYSSVVTNISYSAQNTINFLTAGSYTTINFLSTPSTCTVTVNPGSATFTLNGNTMTLVINELSASAPKTIVFNRIQ